MAITLPPANDAPDPSKRRPAVRKSEGISRRGFASMDPTKQRGLASLGGKTSHANGTGHRWTTEEARLAGRKSGFVRGKGPAKPL